MHRVLICWFLRYSRDVLQRMKSKYVSRLDDFLLAEKLEILLEHRRFGGSWTSYCCHGEYYNTLGKLLLETF